LPHIISNAGGVIVSYLEWLQNRSAERWDEARVNDQMAGYVEKAVKDTYEYAGRHRVSLKEAAFDIAIKRLI
jgi:glutamate dehydrogenase/leucine dehydrogenase